jgi:DNA-binding GntR family transcriptional regulator
MLDALEFVTPANRALSDYVADQLRDAIIHGRLAPGEHIIERDIADAARLSRGPVRDALRILENEGLVIRHPRRGTFVTGMTLRDAEEIYSLRQPLELLAVDYAIRAASEEQFDELDEIVNRMVALLGQDFTQVEATELDLIFHDTLYTISGHRRLQAAWAALRGQVSMLILLHRRLNPTDFREKAIQYHREIIACLRRRDAEAAHASVERHLSITYQSAVAAVREAEARHATIQGAEDGDTESGA